MVEDATEQPEPPVGGVLWTPYSNRWLQWKPPTLPRWLRQDSRPWARLVLPCRPHATRQTLLPCSVCPRERGLPNYSSGVQAQNTHQ